MHADVDTECCHSNFAEHVCALNFVFESDLLINAKKNKMKNKYSYLHFFSLLIYVTFFFAFGLIALAVMWF